MIKGYVVLMNLKTISDNGVSDIVITGNIKSPADNTMLKTAILHASESEHNQQINLKIEDSFIITSSVIGSLLKFIKKDKLPLALHVKNGELYEMLVDMELHRALNATKVQ